jgi:hypothetical protein
MSRRLRRLSRSNLTSLHREPLCTILGYICHWIPTSTRGRRLRRLLQDDLQCCVSCEVTANQSLCVFIPNTHHLAGACCRGLTAEMRRWPTFQLTSTTGCSLFCTPLLVQLPVNVVPIILLTLRAVSTGCAVTAVLLKYHFADCGQLPHPS